MRMPTCSSVVPHREQIPIHGGDHRATGGYLPTRFTRMRPSTCSSVVPHRELIPMHGGDHRATGSHLTTRFTMRPGTAIVLTTFLSPIAF
jgi:hypothetical protein